MKFHRLLRAASMVHAAGLLLLVSACQDTSTPSDRATILRTPQSKAAAASRASPEVADLHARNQHDWVGQEHNRILREFKTRLAQPGVLTRRACDYLVSFVSAADENSRVRSVTPQRRREAALLGLSTTKLCDASGSIVLALPTSAAPIAPQVAYTELSTEANDLANRIITAVDVSESSYYLARNLRPILDAAATLDSVERAVIESSVSVAQNSYEYWEAELGSMEDRYYSDYGACMTQAYQAGYDEDSARDACLNGGLAVTEFLPQPRSLRSPGLSSVGNVGSALRVCGLGDHYRRLAGSDAVGAVTGAVNGARTGGWAGAVAGAVAGAATASLGSFLKSTWEIFWCAM